MLGTPAQFGKIETQAPDIDAQMKLFRGVIITAMGLFAGTVLGGVVGLFVYANSRTPNVHDHVFAAIQTLGVILGVAMGYLAARSAETQEQLVDAAQRAGSILLRKYRPKAGDGGNSDIGHRTIGDKRITARAHSEKAEDFLRTLTGHKN
jgi:hypothetical protein